MNTLEITDESVQKAFYDINNLSVIKYGRVRVWPSISYDDSPYLIFDASEKTKITITGKKGELRLSEDGENFHLPASDNPTVWFGGELGPFWVFGVGDGIAGFQNESSDPTFIVGGNLASAKEETAFYATKSYANFFKGCTVADASTLRLPESYGGAFSAASMFENCANLTKGPKLPSTSLTERCYNRMFQHCTSLNEMPELKATNIPESAYELMFYDCEALKNANTISAKTVAKRGMARMFEKSGIEWVDDLAITTVGYEGCLQMFCKCNSLETAPHFDMVQTVDAYSFDSCFYECENLQTAILRIPLNNEWVCHCTFYKCTNLSYVEIGKPGTGTANNCLGLAFDWCNSLSTVHFNAVTPPYVEGVVKWSRAWNIYLFGYDVSLTFYYPTSVVNRTELLQYLTPSYPSNIITIAE